MRIGVSKQSSVRSALFRWTGERRCASDVIDKRPDGGLPGGGSASSSSIHEIARASTHAARPRRRARWPPLDARPLCRSIIGRWYATCRRKRRALAAIISPQRSLRSLEDTQTWRALIAALAFIWHKTSRHLSLIFSLLACSRSTGVRSCDMSELKCSVAATPGIFI